MAKWRNGPSVGRGSSDRSQVHSLKLGRLDLAASLREPLVKGAMVMTGDMDVFEARLTEKSDPNVQQKQCHDVQMKPIIVDGGIGG